MLCIIIHGQARSIARVDCSRTFLRHSPGLSAHLPRANIESKQRHPSTQASWQAVVSVRHFTLGSDVSMWLRTSLALG